MTTNLPSQVLLSAMDREVIIFSKIGTKGVAIRIKEIKVSARQADHLQLTNHPKTFNTNNNIISLNSSSLSTTKTWLAKTSTGMASTTSNSHRCTCTCSNNNSSSTISIITRGRCLPILLLLLDMEVMLSRCNSLDHHPCHLQIFSNSNSSKTCRTHHTEIINN